MSGTKTVEFCKRCGDKVCQLMKTREGPITEITFVERNASFFKKLLGKRITTMFYGDRITNCHDWRRTEINPRTKLHEEREFRTNC